MDRWIGNLEEGESAMVKTLHGRVHGRTIELEDEPGMADGQRVEVRLRVVEPPEAPPGVSPGLAEIYSILGERYSSGHTDTAERHNEHQP
jgi:hypothetical protein